MLDWLKCKCNVKEEGGWTTVPEDTFLFAPDLKEGAMLINFFINYIFWFWQMSILVRIL